VPYAENHGQSRLVSLLYLSSSSLQSSLHVSFLSFAPLCLTQQTTDRWHWRTVDRAAVPRASSHLVRMARESVCQDASQFAATTTLHTLSQRLVRRLARRQRRAADFVCASSIEPQNDIHQPNRILKTFCLQFSGNGLTQSASSLYNALAHCSTLSMQMERNTIGTNDWTDACKNCTKTSPSTPQVHCKVSITGGISLVCSTKLLNNSDSNIGADFLKMLSANALQSLRVTGRVNFSGSQSTTKICNESAKPATNFSIAAAARGVARRVHRRTDHGAHCIELDRRAGEEAGVAHRTGKSRSFHATSDSK
jgi:hypothetical protein